MQTEIELHRQDGFSKRKHRPDFIFTKGEKTVCVEVELTLKSTDRFEKNIRDNFLKYDSQVWIVPSLNTRIADILSKNISQYQNIKILQISEVRENQ